MISIGGHKILVRYLDSLELFLDNRIGDVIIAACPFHTVNIERVNHLLFGS
jgi:hypothetical protein